MPRAKKFLQRSMLLASRPRSRSAARVSLVSSTWNSRYPSRVWSSSGLVLHCAFLRSVSLKSSRLTMRIPPVFRSAMLVLSAAGFMATRTSTAVPGREDVAGGEVDLEAADPGKSSRRGADLGREVGESGQIVAEKGRRARELGARDLHAVARVSAEADDRVGEGFVGLRGTASSVAMGSGTSGSVLQPRSIAPRGAAPNSP